MANSQTLFLNIKAVADMKDVLTNVESIKSALNKLKLPDDLKTSFSNQFKDLEKEIEKYQKLQANGFKTKGDVNAFTKSGNNIIHIYENIAKKIQSIDDSTLKESFKDLGTQEVQRLKTELESLQSTLKTKIGENNFTSDFKASLKDIQKNFKDTNKDASELAKKLSTSTFSTFTKNLTDGRLDLAANNLKKIETEIGKLKNPPQELINWLTNLKNKFNELSTNSEIQDITTRLGNLKSQLSGAEAQAVQEIIDKFKEYSNAVNQSSRETKEFVEEEEDGARATQELGSELDQIKSRIKHFLGLSNAVNLFKRAVRSAFETVKELDAAMTETAVVTDKTVSDMWGKLPEYTKRANQLGISTVEAYRAATLYYQQGLNDEQVEGLSIETLKMARIAGLDAAEATDRMTNALRGFNMEIDQVNAQRVADVYSQLAAMSASNVDEISTAMTKVASLAHNANMDFETTAAFLAQIIETTRESAETAGTALKTVVARFSEVKKLYDENQLKGADEEGQAIDVNRVAQALRTAGIDLNKYFLGEVGLDDIFMELASKWDTLTSVQQRYIATQAAGSRQQSRFIALMQDYARTQELVGAAYKANGASARQFEKTQDSLQNKLARLKNAWNEFLMGITNSSVIKGIVDRLTDLLNLVNKLSNAFGEGASGVVKFGMAAGSLLALRKMFADGGLFGKLFGAIGKTSIGRLLGIGSTQELSKGATQAGIALKTAGTETGSIFVRSAQTAAAILRQGAIDAATVENAGAGEETAMEISGATAEEGVEAAGATAEEGIENAGATAEEGIEIAGAVAEEAIEAKGGRFSKLFNLMPVAGAVGGATGMANTSALTGGAVMGGLPAAGVAGFAAALLALEVGGIALQDYVASGKANVKQEEKILKQQEKQVNETNDLAAKQKEAYDSYLENEQIAKEATGQERAEAQEKMYEALAILASIDAQNITSTGTLNETYAQEHINTLEKQQKEEENALALQQARIALAQREVELGKKYDLVQDNEAGSPTQGQYFARAHSGSLYESAIHTPGIYDTFEEVEAARKRWNAQQDAAAASFEVQARQEINKFASGLLEGITEDQGVIDSVTQAYSRSLSADKLSEFSNKSQDDIQSELEGLVALAQDENGKLILDAINGSYEIDESKLQSAFNKLTPVYQKIVRNLLGVGDSDTGIFKNLSDINKQIIKSNKENIYKIALDNGLSISNEDIGNINQLNFEQLSKISSIMSKAGQNMTQDLFQSLPGLSIDQLSQIDDFFKDFDLSNPIQAFQQLQKAISEAGGNSTFGKLLNNIKSANEELFSPGSFVQSFIAGGSYDDLTSSIDNFIKENGKITSKNIEELAENCDELKFLLDQDTISAQGLASAFTLFENGSIAIDNITDSLLAALSAGESFETLIGNVGQWIEDFSEGTDLTEGTQHIVEVLEKAGEYITDWQFGNKPLMNIYDHIFGPGAYNTYMRDEGGWKKPFEEIEKDLRGQIDKIKGYAENEGLGALQFLAGQEGTGITEIGKNQFSWDLSGYQHASDAISDIAGKLGVTDDVARAFIESWSSHMYDLGQAWDELSFRDSITAFNKALGDSAVITEQELNALVMTTGKTKDEILAAIEAIRGEGNVPIVVSWQDENGNPLSDEELVSKFENTIRRSTGQFVTSANSVYSSFLKDFLNEDGLINADELISHLVNDFKLSPAQASTVADNMADSVGKSFSKEIEVPVVTVLKDENGNPILDANNNKQIQVTSKKWTITGSSIAELNAAEAAAQAAGAQASMAEILADIDTGGLTENVQGALESAGEAGAASIKSAIEGLSPTVKINFSGLLGGIFGGPVAAKGGIVGSYAGGSSNNRIKPGLALTGEEDPEIVWNGEKGYAYLAGKHGPEINNLRPGDQVFNAQDTKAILRRSGISSFAKGTIHSYRYVDPQIDEPTKGGWKPDSKNSTDSNNNNTSKKAKDSKWQNTLDWLYNLMEDIAELERIQNQISEKHERYLEDISKTGRDLYNLTQDELNNLYTQRDNYQEALTRRMQEMREQVEDSKVSQYAWWNDEDNTIEIDWDAINEITNKDKYDEVTDLISKLEKIQDQMDEAEEALWDIEGQIIELEKRYLDEFIDLQKRVYDALVDSYQKQIDSLEDLNDTLNDSNEKILNSIQKEIDLQRQIRENTETENNIKELEARLAYLRRDTTGANEKEIRDLEKQLEEARNNYLDTLVDQALERLQQSNEDAAEQREKQIDLLTEQLDYWKEVGALWPEVARLLDEGINGDGSLIRGSTLEQILQEAEGWKAMSEQQREVWANDLILAVNQAGAYLLKISEGFNSLSEGIWAIIPESSIPKKHYATGGLATSTGPAWLDGTVSEPEYVLNARQTDAFLRLAEVLPAMFSASGGVTNNLGGNLYVELNMNVGEIGSDYDVDRLVDRIKKDLYDAGSYRNVNAVNFLR